MKLAELRSAAYYRLFSVDGLLRRISDPGTRILDVGCSDGRGSAVLGAWRADGVDVHRPALEHARRLGRRGRVVQADVRWLPFRDRAYDVVVALDLVEHLDKPDAVALLGELERVARSTVVVVTPSGFLPQPATADEPWQEHRCGFEAEELAGLGYSVRGLGGPAALRRDRGAFRFGILGQAAGLLAAPWARRRPDHAFALVAVKSAGV
ncbi:MAG: class I SAM-dependent methyltransferase [Acidimicrobiia bacterium]|nr:class I SAM-dependent methyltransferase [Acidimicrobiia bacterium]